MKILIDLNIEKKITMIMVTHDVGLKGFADKVVRMADGKVHNIEYIDPSIKQDMVESLTDRVRKLQSGEDTG